MIFKPALNHNQIYSKPGLTYTKVNIKSPQNKIKLDYLIESNQKLDVGYKKPKSDERKHRFNRVLNWQTKNNAPGEKPPPDLRRRDRTG